ncbi:SAM-dependent methyltransferase [Streptomyces sp. NPDC101165]|uniref:SAM-dependent methyltransferase n=1 Tax=Streptomyces sp. NPDC101165 TaxID=3366119 RepID=UPI0037F78A3D
MGLPTQVGVHQIAQSIDVRCRIVYADDDPLALTHARAWWERPRRTLVLRAGPEQAAQLLLDPRLRARIAPALPRAVLFVSADLRKGNPDPVDRPAGAPMGDPWRDAGRPGCRRHAHDGSAAASA